MVGNLSPMSVNVVDVHGELPLGRRGRLFDTMVDCKQTMTDAAPMAVETSYRAGLACQTVSRCYPCPWASSQPGAVVAVPCGLDYCCRLAHRELSSPLRSVGDLPFPLSKAVNISLNCFTPRMAK